MSGDVFEKLNLAEVARRLSGAGRYLLLVHTKPDGDCLGSAQALAEMLGQLGSTVDVLCADPVPASLAPLVKAPVYCRDTLPAQSYDGVVAVDVASPKQLGDNEEEFAPLVDLTIDHHATATRFSDYYADPAASSVGEILVALAAVWQKLGKPVTVTREIAAALYLSIDSDTGCFRYPNTTPDTLRAAAELLAVGVDAPRINKLLYFSRTREELDAERIALENLQVFCGGKLAVVLLDEKHKAGLPYDAFFGAVDVARSLAGVKCAAAIKASDEDPSVFRVSMRSEPGFDCSAVCAAFGGGGHRGAAGCTLGPTTAEEALWSVVREVERNL